MKEELLRRLNAGEMEGRLVTLSELIGSETDPPARQPRFANNHIHTFYSFSPYSPAAAVYFARQAGLETAGIMDHDTMAGAREFIRAGEIASVATTIGMEFRVSFAGTPFADRRINNPDQNGVVYMALHGVPHQKIDFLQKLFAPLRGKRNERSRKMVQNINALTRPLGVALDFDRDVLPLSRYSEGGSVTERHLLFALAGKLTLIRGRAGTASILEDELGLMLNRTLKERLCDPDNPYFDYDLLGALKSGLVERIYVPAAEECLTLKQAAALAEKTGAVFCYPYLGDVGDSVTGDKKTQKFEDDFLEELARLLHDSGVQAMTYMPSRNTPAQLARVRGICKKYGFWEISGEDINSPRQPFICSQLALPEFSHLTRSTWELIRYEREKSLIP